MDRSALNYMVEKADRGRALIKKIDALQAMMDKINSGKEPMHARVELRSRTEYDRGERGIAYNHYNTNLEDIPMDILCPLVDEFMLTALQEYKQALELEFALL